MKQIFALILLLFVSVALKAQERYKEYYDDGKDIGLLTGKTEQSSKSSTIKMEKKKANTTSTTTKDAYILWKLTTTECYTEQCCNTTMNPIEKDNCHFMHEQPTKMECQ